MASETVVSHHTATDQKVEEKPHEELKTIAQDNISPTKEIGEEKAKAVELSSSEECLSKIEEKTEDKLIAESPSPAIPLSDTEDKQSRPPPVLEEVVKSDDTCVVDVPIKENLEVAQDPISEPDTSTIPKAVAEVVKSQPEEQLADESVEKEPKEQPEMESIKKPTEEQPEIVDVPESSVEVLEKQVVPLEVPPVKEPEAIAVKERDEPEAEVPKDEKPEPGVSQVEEKPGVVLEKKEEPLEVPPLKEPEAIVVKEREEPEAEVTKGGKPEPAVSQVEEKPGVVLEKQEEPLEVPTLKEPEAIAVKEREEPEPEVIKDEKPEPAVTQVEEKLGVVLEKQEEPLKVPPLKEPEAIVVKECKDSEAESIKVEKPEPAVPQVEEKPGEQSGLTEQVEEKCEEVEPQGSLAGETVKEEGTLVEKVEPKGSVAGEIEKEGTLAVETEDVTISKKEQTGEDQELFATDSSDQVVSINQEAQSVLKGDGGDFTLLNVVEKAGTENIEKEASGANVVEGLSNEAAVELGKVDKENEAKNFIKEVNEEKNVMTDLLAQAAKVEDVNSSISTAEVTEKSFEGENTSRDVELVAEHKKEDIEDEKPASVKTGKDGDIEGKLDENIAAIAEQVGEAQESKLEVKGEETVKDGVDKSETEKADAPNLEPSSKDLPKEVPAKPTQKQSNNILTRVKKSLVKAKKAIIGKSPGSKTLSSETKGDIEVK